MWGVREAEAKAGKPAFYALAPGGWRDYVTLLHPPYTAWHLSYVAIGAALTFRVRLGPLPADARRLLPRGRRRRRPRRASTGDRSAREFPAASWSRSEWLRSPAPSPSALSARSPSTPGSLSSSASARSSSSPTTSSSGGRFHAQVRPRVGSAPRHRLLRCGRKARPRRRRRCRLRLPHEPGAACLSTPCATSADGSLASTDIERTDGTSEPVTAELLVRPTERAGRSRERPSLWPSLVLLRVL